MNNTELVIFDLDDTLSESKTDMERDMANLLFELLKRVKVGIISGCAYEQFEKQVFKQLNTSVFSNPNVLNNLYVMPSSGSQLFQHDVMKKWHRVYHDTLLLREKVLIYNAFQDACVAAGHLPRADGAYGEIGEDRDSQITFSMLGQKAPLSLKKLFDPDQSKRLVIAGIMNDKLTGEYEATVGGATSIDITRKGSNKASGVNKLLDYLKIDKSKVIFVADALFPGGNDHSVISTGVKCIPTKSIKETEEIIKIILGEIDAAV